MKEEQANLIMIGKKHVACRLVLRLLCLAGTGCQQEGFLEASWKLSEGGSGLDECV